jgi:hypothetical protein
VILRAFQVRPLVAQLVANVCTPSALSFEPASMAYKIRLRSPTGGATCDVNPDWTMGQLKSHISGLVNVPIHKQRRMLAKHVILHGS